MTIEVGEVGMIPIVDIVVGERAREVMGDLDGLEANMKESGLIQPLAVKALPESKYFLLAGERRYTVLLANQVLMVPARIYRRDLSELEMKIIEKSENLFRKDMEYYEFDELTRQIHVLSQQVYGAKPRGPSEEGWGTKETAEVVGISQGMVSPAIARAEARELYPELFENCKTASDATKVIKKLDEAMVKRELAERMQAEDKDTSIRKLADRFIIKDCLEGIKDIPSGTINLVEIDPPYAINLTNQKKKDGESQYILENYNEITPEKYREFIPKLLTESFRVMTDNSWLICWFAPHPWFEEMFQWIRQAGFGTTRLCGIWTKGIPGQSMNPTIRLANSYEMFFYAWKGSPALNKPGHGNDFHFSPVPSQSKVHPTERPIELMKDIYETFTFVGSRLLIPLLGSGNGLLAAHELGIQAIGFELTAGYKDSFLVKAHSLLSKDQLIIN